MRSLVCGGGSQVKFSRSTLARNRAIRFLMPVVVIGLLAPVSSAVFPADDGPLIKYAAARSALQAYLQPEWPVTFNAGEAGRWLLQDGFDFSEPDGTWMTGRTGALRFRAPDGTSPISIQLNLIPFIPSGTEFRVIRFSSSIDERTMQVYPGGTTLELALDGDQEQEIFLDCEDAISPTASGDASDLRRLCVKLLEASLRYE